MQRPGIRRFNDSRLVIRDKQLAFQSLGRHECSEFSSRIPAGSTPRWRFPGCAEQYDAEIIAVTVDLGQGRELVGRARAGAGGRRGARPRDRRARRVRARLHPAGAAGRRRLRGSVSAGHRARPAAHRQAPRRRSRGWKGRRAIAHGCTGEGQRPGASRRRRRARSIRRSRSSRRRARGAMTRPDEIEYARVRNISRARDERQPVQHRHEPVGPRRSSAACSRIRGSSRPDDIYTLTRSPQRLPRRARLRRDRVRGGRAGARQRRSRCRCSS